MTYFFENNLASQPEDIGKCVHGFGLFRQLISEQFSVELIALDSLQVFTHICAVVEGTDL